MICVGITLMLSSSRASGAHQPSVTTAASNKTATANYDKLRAEADNSRATADKARIDANHAEQSATATYDALRASADKARSDANVAAVTQWTSGITAVATTTITILAVLIVALASPRIFNAATAGAITLNVPFIGSISLAQKNAAEQQQTSPPPAIAPEPIGSANNPSTQQIAAVSTLTRHIVGAHEAQPRTPSAIVSAVRTHSSEIQEALPKIAGISPSTDTYFRAFFRNLFLSQFDLLAELVALGSMTVSDVKTQYNRASASGLKALSFENWVNYLLKYGMINAVDLSNPNVRVVATDRAKDFTTWSKVTNHGEDQIRAANLWN
jgi:hypothetical protein